MRDRSWYKNYFFNFFLIISVLQVLDVLTTLFIVSAVNLSVENNPMIRFALSMNNGTYLLILIKSILMLLYFFFAWTWVNHPINFYKENQQIAFKIVPILIWFMYSVIVALNLIGIFFLRWYL